MTNQELFDLVVTKLRAQGEPSIRRGACRYRGPGGLKCAAGHLIPDDLYRPTLEGENVLRDINVQNVLLSAGVKEAQLQLVQSLQFAHDRPTLDGLDGWLSAFLENARRTAKHFQLSDEVCQR